MLSHGYLTQGDGKAYIVPPGGVALYLSAPAGYVQPLTETIITTAGCFELELPVPVPPAPSLQQVAASSAIERIGMPSSAAA